jgi:hypothetical protein
MARKCPCTHLHPSSKHVERLHWQDIGVLRGVTQSDIIFGVSLDIILMLAYREYVLLLAGKLSARASVHR